MTRPTLAWTLAIGAGVVALVVVGVPVWLIQPFAPQTPAGVAWSWRLRQIAPAVSLGAAIVVLAAAAVIAWLPARSRRHRTLRASGLAVVAAIALATAWFARQNHFEWMFRPFPDPRFVAAAAATDVPAQEPVIGVAGDGAALAFPITRIGYHHVVNATLGAVPIVATY
jgi:hypothetical protein